MRRRRWPRPAFRSRRCCDDRCGLRVGLFAGLSGLFLATTTLHLPSPACLERRWVLVFSSGVVSQLATARLRASHVLALGVTSMVVGLGLLVTTVRLTTPSLALFLVGGALIGAGVGLVFKALLRSCSKQLRQRIGSR